MAAKDYEACELRVLAHEGSEYTDGVHPYDPGGPTRWGITIADVRQFLKPGATAEDVKRLTKQQAMDIYRPHYWVPIRGDDLPAGVDYAIYDYGINSGISRAGKVLRRVLGLSDSDWHVTDEVLSVLKRRDPVAVINAICEERMRFLRGLPIWSTYQRGWTTRVNEVRSFSKQLAQGAVALPQPTAIPSISMGKGTIAAPKKTTTSIATGSGMSIGMAIATGWQHITAHPFDSILIIGIVAMATILLIRLINRAHEKSKDAPPAGGTPLAVPL